MKTIQRILFLFALCSAVAGYSQTVVLNANPDGSGDTYKLINSKFALEGGDVVEVPGDHPSVKHIKQVWDSVLKKYVFEFSIHKNEDNDRNEIDTTRQRVEIKTYEKSPENLLGRVGETIIYKWRFRLDVNFKPSEKFTHLHQIKPVGKRPNNDEDELPIFTLTARKKGSASKDEMELNYNDKEKVAWAYLSEFRGEWVEVTEQIRVDPDSGAYSINIKNCQTGNTILSYTNNHLMTIRPNNRLVRPKWGIYRSLLDKGHLRNEKVLFSDFSIQEPTVLNATGPANFSNNTTTYELINSVLAPNGGDVVEAPCAHSVRHIKELWNKELKRFVFEFSIHKENDNGCTSSDATSQRIEIKTYDKSPDKLKGTIGETIVYNWFFRLSGEFKSSTKFTHLHQIKPVTNVINGSETSIITLTARTTASGEEWMDVVHYGQEKLARKELSYFKGKWVNVTERITLYPDSGAYSILITDVSSGDTILWCKRDTLNTISNDDKFVRPKWGIYRGVDACLKDEKVLFASFSILEESQTSGPNNTMQGGSQTSGSNNAIEDGSLTPDSDNAMQENGAFFAFPNPATQQVSFEYYVPISENVKLEIYDTNGRLLKTLLDERQQEGKHRQTFDLSYLPEGVYFARLSAGNYQKTIILLDR